MSSSTQASNKSFVLPASRSFFLRRRLRNTLLTASVLLLFAIVVGLQTPLLDRSWVTGWTLLGVLGFLTALSIRKRLAFLPLGSVSSWMQWHLQAGWASVVLFAWHVGPRIPDGTFEFALAFLFLSVAGSGVFGWRLSRSAPRQLAMLPHEVRYEAIPARRLALAEHVRAIVLESAKTTGVLGDFYLSHCQSFFERPRSLIYRLIPTGTTRRRLEAQALRLDRYLTDQERDLRQRLSLAIREKDDLDFHAAIQGRLKYWLFAHLATTYSMWILVVVHVVLVHAFRGS